MELVYVAMLLHKAGKQITEDNVRKVIHSVGIDKTDAEIKALIAALDGVDIESAIKEAAMPVATATVVVEAKKEEKKEEKKVDEGAAAAGLSALFG